MTCPQKYVNWKYLSWHRPQGYNVNVTAENMFTDSVTPDVDGMINMEITHNYSHGDGYKALLGVCTLQQWTTAVPAWTDFETFESCILLGYKDEAAAGKNPETGRLYRIGCKTGDFGGRNFSAHIWAG